MKAWAIIDSDPDRRDETAEYRDREIYILFNFSTRDSSPNFQVFDYRHRNYADAALKDWIDSDSHPNARLVEVEITIKKEAQ
jgi:hypothetical protein